MDKDHRQSIKRLRERCENRENMSAEDADAILEFSDRLDLLGSEYSDERHEFHLMRIVNVAASVGGVADALESREAAEEIVRWIHAEYDNPETNKDYRTALRMFGEHSTDGEGKPDSIDWVPSGYPSNYDPAPNPGDMLRWEEHILPMVESCQNARDKALIALAWDLGPRPGELYDLTLGDFEPGKYGFTVTVSGKVGQRSPTIVPAEPYVNRWLEAHPVNEPGVDPIEDPEAVDVPVWTKLNSTDKISFRMLSKAIEAAAERVGVTRPVTPTNFRKSSAAYLASQNVSQAHLEAHHGWSTGSDVASRYVDVFAEASEREVARAHGVDVSEDEPDPTAPLTCPRCGNATPRHKESCVHCHRPMSPEGVEEQREAEGDVRETLAKLPPDVAEQVVATVEAIDENPELAAAFRAAGE